VIPHPVRAAAARRPTLLVRRQEARQVGEGRLRLREQPPGLGDAEEMASQAESLQQLMTFFALRGHGGAPARLHAVPAPKRGSGGSTAAAVALAPALPEGRRNGSSPPEGRRNGAPAPHADGGFKRF
jgi:hypothetical protein